MPSDPTPDERRALRLVAALVEIDPDAHGPRLTRVALDVMNQLPPTLAEDLLQMLESPAGRRRLLEQRLRDERYGPHPTTMLDPGPPTIEGLTRSAAAIVEDLDAHREARS